MFLRFSEKLKSSAGDFRVSSLVFEKVPYLGRGGVRFLRCSKPK